MGGNSKDRMSSSSSSSSSRKSRLDETETTTRRPAAVGRGGAAAAASPIIAGPRGDNSRGLGGGGGRGATAAPSASAGSAGATAGFIGFSAYATAPATTVSGVRTPQSPPQEPQQLQWGPVYTGHDSELRTIFQRIVNKRDVVTKCKALQDLAGYVRDWNRWKKNQVDAITHFAYHLVVGTRLAHNLGADSGSGSGGGGSFSSSSPATNTASTYSSVRAECVHVFVAALQRIPKATLLLAQTHLEVAGVLESWRCDPTASVRTAAVELHKQHQQLQQQQPTLIWPAAEGLANYSRHILSYSTSAAMYDGFTRMAGGGGGGGSTLLLSKSSPSSSPSPSSVKDMSDAQKEALEEAYVRLVTTVLSSLALHLSESNPRPNNNASSSSSDADVVFHTSDVNLWGKSLLAPSAAIRRCSYQLLSAVALRHPNLLARGDGDNAMDDDCNSSRPPPMATLINTLVQALGQERQPGNVPGLLELVLATTTTTANKAAAQRGATNTAAAAAAAAATALEKPVARLVRKAGYGARVDQWGPMLLPLVSQCSQPLLLAHAMKDGRSSTLGQRDAAGLLVAQIESVTYLLLRVLPNPSPAREQDDESKGTDGPHTLVDLWIDAYETTLRQEVIDPSLLASALPSDSNRRTTTSPTAGTHVLQQLATALAKSWVQLERAAQSNRRCEFQNVSQLLWDKATARLVDAVSTGASNNTRIQVPILTLFVASVRNQIQEPDAACDRTRPVHLTAALKRYVAIDLRPYQSSSSSVPTMESYQLYRQVLALADGDPSAVLPTNIERFVMNDLLRWMILHTSELSTVQQTRELAQHDFALLALLADEPSARIHSEGNPSPPVARQLWPSLLNELHKAKIDVRWFVVGLQTLLRNESAHTVEWIPCSVLDEYATSSAVLDDAAQPNNAAYDDDDDDDDDASSESADDEAVARHRLEFFRLCLGIGGGRASRLLVSRAVLSLWLERLCPAPANLQVTSALSRRNSSLLTAMLEAINRVQVLDPQDTLRVLVTAWLSGRSLVRVPSFGGSALDESLVHRFLDRASELLTQRLASLVSVSDLSLPGNHRERTSWITSAWSLLEVLDARGEEHRLDRLGLSNLQLWEDRPDLLFHLLTQLLDKYDEPRARLTLVASASCGTEVLLCNVLLKVSDASADAAKACRVKLQLDRPAQLLRALGGKEISAEILDKLVDRVISTLVELMKNGGAQSSGGSMVTTKACVGVLSQLLTTRFRSVRDAASKIPDPQMVHEGDSLWYITDPEDDNSARLAKVVKVHYEADVGYYFAIQLEENGETRERQTVISRLRRTSPTSGTLAWSEMSDEEQEQRSKVRRTLIHDIILPFGAPDSWTTLVPELIPVVCGTVGLGPERGLGTDHYALVRHVQDLSRSLLMSFGSDRPAEASQLLRALSLSLGFGLNVPLDLRWTMQQLSFDVVPTLNMLTGSYERIGVGSDPELDTAALIWLSTAFDSNHRWDESSSIDSALLLLFQLAKNSLARGDRSRRFTEDDVLAVRALHVGMTCLMPVAVLSDQLVDVAQRAIRTLLQWFCWHWPDHVEYDAFGNSEPDWRSCTPFLDIIALCRTKLKLRPLFMEAMDEELCERLVDCLLVKSKRHASMYLLDCRLRMGMPLFEGSHLNSETSDRLEDWVTDLEDEEADEVRDDVAIVAPYLPRRLMWEIEDWGEKLYEEDADDDAMLGRLLMWLCVLGAVDAVSPSGFRFRPAFVSYLHRSGAANAALNLALLHDEAINETHGKMPPSLLDVDLLHGDESFLLVPKVSSLVLFQTVEVLPSLSRRWWEESCPKPYLADVQRFVEQFVAPAILERELSRIRSSSSSSPLSTSAGGRSSSSFGDMQVKSSLHKREVTASYVQDDFTLSVTINMPPDFPLKSAVVDCSQTLGVPQSRWKRWSLQITLMLNSEGGTLQDALLLWKDNVDREFDGVEPCPVCYSVLHVKTHKLPSLECTTCHHRFHVDCLMQWFRSSGKSSCVLCQQPWQGTRV